MNPGRVIRLAIDLNVLWSDQRARDQNVRGTAASMLVDAVRDGTCPAGPVQLITSVAVIEAWADVLRRHFGYGPDAAQEKAGLLQEYATQGPLAAAPHLVVGRGTSRSGRSGRSPMPSAPMPCRGTPTSFSTS